MDTRLEEAQKIAKEYEEQNQLAQVEDFIKDNKVKFTVDSKNYRIRLLNLSEKNELDTLRRKKFGQLLQDRDILLEKDLIKQYKERGIDISELDDNMKKIEAEMFDLQMKLGESIAKNEGNTVVDTYKQQVEGLITEKNTIFAQKSMFLEYSLENQLLSYVYQIITYLSLEQSVEDTWKRMFTTFENFEKATEEQEKVINTAAQYTVLLQNV